MKNDDYLWAKIGSDPEIEQLENALAVYRFRDAAEPAPAANVIPFRPRAPKHRLAFAYAAAASLLLAALLGLVLSRRSGVEDAKLAAVPSTEETQAVIPGFDTLVPQKDEPSAINPRAARISVKLMDKPAGTKAFVAMRQKRIPKAASAATKQSLTKEEKYAYDRLMLALAITSSNLKLVADKIDGPADSADGGR
jgi:hypothetical protein